MAEEADLNTYRDMTNRDFVAYLMSTLSDSSRELKDLQSRIKRKDSLLTNMNLGLYLLGMCLIATPLILLVLRGDQTSSYPTLIGGLGLVEIVALMVTNPIKTTHKYMGDFAQVSVALTGFVEQVACIIIATDLTDDKKRESFLEATDKIGIIKCETMVLVQRYFEEQPIADAEGSQSDS